MKKGRCQGRVYSYCVLLLDIQLEMDGPWLGSCDTDLAAVRQESVMDHQSAGELDGDRSRDRYARMFFSCHVLSESRHRFGTTYSVK